MARQREGKYKYCIALLPFLSGMIFAVGVITSLDMSTQLRSRVFLHQFRYDLTKRIIIGVLTHIESEFSILFKSLHCIRVYILLEYVVVCLPSKQVF